MSWLLTTLLACSTPSPPPTAAPREATPPPRRQVTTVSLARGAPPISVSLPRSTRPGNAPPPDTFSPVGRVTIKERKDGLIVYRVPLPAHSNLFPAKQAGARSFGNFAPPGLTVRVGGKALSFKRFAHQADSYGYDRSHLLIGLDKAAPQPRAADITLTWPKATDRENALHWGSSGQTPEAFIQQSLTVGVDAHTGLLLPAPAIASWTLEVPAHGVFSTRATILPPAITGAAPSDGAIAALFVKVDDGPSQEVAIQPVEVDTWTEWRADLAAWAGQTVTLTLETRPGAEPDFDLVFLEEPTVYTPKKDPKRVVVVFLDTVRRDHLGFYGYSRDTTPKLDRWAADALRMDDNRTVAPWTLPSTRAAMTGHQPEQYFDVPTLPQQLAEAGFYTSGIVANAYLSQTFDMHRGFAHYRYRHLLAADELVDHALEVMSRHEDRDTMVWVQFMEAHLPFMEPPAYRSLFAGDKPDSLRSVSRVELVKLKTSDPEFDVINTYVQARYDQNIRVLDDQVSRLIRETGDDATVVMFADHGEEFWDHGGYEHGHTFYDELLAVPLVIRDPHLPAGVLQEPTSLLDLAPTVLDLVGVDPGTRPGQSLVSAAFGDDAARDALRDRPHGFGRPLYGHEGWGVVDQQQKWWQRDGAERHFDLTRDPGEQTPLSDAADPSGFHDALADALARDVVPLWRVRLTPRKLKSDVTLRVEHPQGFSAVWKGYDPRGNHDTITPTVVDGAVVVTQPAGQRLPSTLFLRPSGDHGAPEGLTLQLSGDALNIQAEVKSPPKDDVILASTHPAWRIRIDRLWAPVPSGREVEAFHPDVAEQLEALGYLDED